MKRVLYHIATGQVMQWQDTDKFNYAEPPEDMALLEVTEEEYANQEGVWYVDNGKLTQTNPHPPTVADIQAQMIAQVNALNTQLLQPTDFIITKISEATALGQDVTALKKKYAKQLAYRTSVREWVANTKAAITAATTMEELEAINLTNYPKEA